MLRERQKSVVDFCRLYILIGLLLLSSIIIFLLIGFYKVLFMLILSSPICFPLQTAHWQMPAGVHVLRMHHRRWREVP